MRYLIVLIVCGLTSCAVQPNRSLIGDFPTDFKETIKAHVLRTFYDPYSIRSASVTLPFEGHIFYQQGWIVCLEANSKNKLGGYTGLSRTAFLINSDKVLQSVVNPQFCNSPQITYRPWSELEQTTGQGGLTPK